MFFVKIVEFPWTSNSSIDRFQEIPELPKPEMHIVDMSKAEVPNGPRWSLFVRLMKELII